MIERLAAASRAMPVTEQSLPPELQRVVQILCEAYETLDLRIETTLVAAEDDFLAALPEIAEHETDVRQFVALLVDDLRLTVHGASSQSVLLRLAFQDEDDLTQQLLSNMTAQEVEP
jgi:hypothetical protein